MPDLIELLKQQQKQPELQTVPSSSSTVAVQKPSGQQITVSLPAQTVQLPNAQQRLQQQPEPEAPWYKGSQPTGSEVLARVYTIGQQNPRAAREAFALFQTFQMNPASPYYNPYAQSTNQAVQELRTLGFDLRGGVTQEWLNQNSYLKNYYRTGVGGTPLSPSSKSTKEQNAAYWYYKLLGAEATTQRAEAEWAALQEEVAFWAQRKDRNYSDDEILAKIDWRKYSTLAGMDADRQNGTPTTLNRGIGYSQDLLRGVIWAARNNGGTGDLSMDSVRAVLGMGNTWQEDPAITAKLDPANGAYSPYSVGSTLDDAALYFGVSHFDGQWLEANRGILGRSDTTAKKYYRDVYAAEQITQQAEAELAMLWGRVDNWIKYTSDPDIILEGLLDAQFDEPALSALKKMDESLKTGDLLPTTRAIPYRWQDVEAEVRARCEKINTVPQGGGYVQTVSNVLQFPISLPESSTAVQTARDNAINAAGPAIIASGTAEEKTVFQTAYSSDFDTYVEQIAQALQQGTLDAQGGYDHALKQAEDYTARYYLNALQGIRPYEQLQADLAALEEQRNHYKRQLDMDEALYAWEDRAPYASALSPSTTLQVNGLPYHVGATLNPETGTWQVSEPERLPDSRKTTEELRHALNDALVQYDPTEEGAQSSNAFFDQAVYPLILEYAQLYSVPEDDANALADAFYDQWLDLFYQEGNTSTRDSLIADLVNRIESAGTAPPTFDDAAARKAAEQWGAELPDFSGYTRQGRVRHLTGEELEQAQQQIRSLTEQLQEKREQLSALQPAYDAGQEELQRIEKIYQFAEDLQKMNGLPAGDTLSLRSVLDMAYRYGAEYRPTEWATQSVFEDFLQSGFPLEETAQIAQMAIQENQDTLAQLTYALQRLDRAGAQLPGDYQINLRREQDRLTREIRAAQYFLLRSQPDFGARVERVKREIDAATGIQAELGSIQSIGDAFKPMSQRAGSSYSYLSRLPDYAVNPAHDIPLNPAASLMGDTASGAQPAARQSKMSSLTQEERDTYLYILDTQGEIAAKAYYDFLVDDTYGVVQVRDTLKQNEVMQQFAKDSPFAAMMFSILASQGQLEGMGYALQATLLGQEINPYNERFLPAWAVTTTRGLSKAEMLGELDPDSLGYKMASIGYDAFTSGSESMLNMAATSVFSGLGKVAAPFLRASVMGLRAAGTAAQDAKLRGATDAQAMMLAGATYLAETVSEVITTQNIAEAIEGGVSGVKGLLKRFLAQDAVEEFVGEAANELVEGWADDLIMGKLSNREAAITQYQTQGMTPEEARNQANEDFWRDVLIAGLTGALSSQGTVAVSYSMGKISNLVQLGAAQQAGLQLVQEQLSTPAVTEITPQETTTETTPQDMTPEPAVEAVPEETAPDRGETMTVQELTTKQLTALTEALRADEASQTATIGAILAPEQPSADGLSTASAAAQHLSVQLGSDNAVQLMRDILTLAAQHKMEATEGLKVGLTVAALNEGGQANNILRQMTQEGVTLTALRQLVETAVQEMQTPEVAERLRQTVTENEVANQTKNLIAEGALEGLRAYETALQQSKTNERTAQASLEQAQQQQAVLGQNLQNVQAEFAADPTDAALRGAMQQAIKDIEGQVKVVEEYQQRLINAQAALQSAQTTLEAQRETVLKNIRQQAQAYVAAAQEQRTQAQAQRNYDRAIHETEEQRTARLAGTDLAIAWTDQNPQSLTADEVTALERKTRREARQYVKELLKKFSILKEYSNPQADMVFTFGKNQLDESLNTQTARGKSYGDFAQMLLNMEKIVENAIPIESHTDKYVGSTRVDRTLDRSFVFVSAYQDGGQIAPVQLEVKQFKDGKDSILYVATTLDKINAAETSAALKAGVRGADLPSSSQEAYVHAPRPATISIPELIGKINPADGDFLKYVPDSMLTAEQLTGKNAALEREKQKIQRYKKDDSGGPGEGGPSQEIKAYRGNAQQGTPGSQPQGTPEKSPQQITKTLTEKLGLGQAIGTRKMNSMPQAVLGYYEQRAKYIAARNVKAGSFAVGMHEIGHAIADRLGITGTQDMVNHLDPLFAANYRPTELPGEAFAEFMWRYMADEQIGRAFAGDAFVDDLEVRMQQAGIAKDVHDAARQLRTWINAGVNDQIGATIRSRSEKPRVGWAEQFRRFIDSTVDATNAAEAVSHQIREQTGKRDIPLHQDIRANALMKNFANRRAYAILTQNLTDAHWTRIGDSLADVFDQAGLQAKDVALFERLLLAEHSLDRDAQDKPVFDDFITPSARQTFIQETLQAHPEFAEAERGFQQWRKDFLQAFLVDTGYLSQEAFDRMNAMYPHYVPTLRVKDERAHRSPRSNTYQVRAATGSTEDIWSPLDSFVNMVDSVVAMVSANNVALAWDNAYHAYSLGEFGRKITPDSRQVTVDVTELQQQVNDLLTGQVDDDLFQQVIDLIGTRQSQWIQQQGSSLPNTLTVQLPDGGQHHYEIFDTELYKLLASVQDRGISRMMKGISTLTRFMSALTTGSNPVFAIRNFMRDFQNSVDYGSWASNYASGAIKWLGAAFDVWRQRGAYQDYAALGGGGWTRIETGTRKGAAEIKASLYPGYNTQNVGQTAKWAGQKLWNAITLSRLNEIVEQTSRYAEYKYGSHDLTTAEGRTAAFLAAQEATVDFARSGNGRLGAELKALVPFFGASVQGVYRTSRMLTEAERGRAPIRFTKIVLNTALMSALCNALMMKYSDKDEQEEFVRLSHDLKSKHMYLPNFAPDVLGAQPLVRIPIGQDPLMYAVHGAVTNAMWNGTADEAVIELAATANTILDNLNPLGSGTILQPVIGIGQNRNWYGSRIVPARMENWEPTTQYTEETPDILVSAGRITGMSPLNLQYLAEQYTGFLGQMLIPALSKDRKTGKIGGLSAALTAAQKRLTSDPLISNEVLSSFYDGATVLTQVTDAAKNDRPLNMLRRGLSPEEATAAYEEAKEMTAANGIIGQTKKIINANYSEIDTINANDSLTPEQKYTLTSEKRREMIAAALEAQEAIGAYKEKYITGRNVANDALYEGTYAYIPNAYDKMDSTFKADAGETYMQRANAVWEATGNSSALPHPNRSFNYTPKGGKQTEVQISESDWGNYTLQYKMAYRKYLVDNGKLWDALDNEQQLELLRKAHTAGHNAAVKWYRKLRGIK